MAIIKTSQHWEVADKESAQIEQAARGYSSNVIGVLKMQAIKMIVSVTKNAGTAAAKREAIGEVKVYVPTLTEIAASIGSSKQALDEKQQPIFDTDGTVVYDTDAANWIQNAIANAVKMSARNKLEPQSTQCKEGLKIAETMDELCAESSRGGNGEGLAILREAKELFAAWAGKQGKSADTTALLITLFANRQALATQGASVKEKMKGYVEAFAVTLNEEQADRYTRPIEAVLKGCETPDTVGAATDF